MTTVPTHRIPVHLLTGFLGSGKTTLLNRVLRAPGMEGTLVIVNEFGEVGLDHLLIETPEDETILLANGCLCCAMLGDLVLTLSRLAERLEAGEIPAVQRIVIETTGLADPVPLLRTLQDDAFIAERFMLSGVVAVVDGCSGEADLDRHREALKQAAAADRLVISKTDIAEREAVAALTARLAEINPGVEIRATAIADAEIVDLFRRSGEQRASLSWLAPRTETSGHGGVHHHHHGGDGIGTFSVRHEPPVSAEGLRLWLNALGRFRGPNLLRMKGLINVEGSPVVVHAVQQVISEPVALAAWPSADRASQLVFITQGLSRAELEATLAAFAVTPAEDRIGDLAFGPESYGRFVAALENFGLERNQEKRNPAFPQNRATKQKNRAGHEPEDAPTRPDPAPRERLG
jgi:G3E family GTPase